MNTDSYDVNRMACLIVHYVLGFGADTGDVLSALRLAETMLRDAADEERRRAQDPGHPMIAAG
ncbi:hypothetical protein BOSP111201_16100 [Bordetella sputigena]|uniref:hypothetical protein n=1 Tax=Bordetella sputigena TaxID=1416810 RepID=UPI0039EE2F59